MSIIKLPRALESEALDILSRATYSADFSSRILEIARRLYEEALKESIPDRAVEAAINELRQAARDSFNTRKRPRN